MLTLIGAILTLCMGLPVVFVLGLVGMAYLYSLGMPFILMPQRIFVGMDSFILLAIPFYVLMGNIMTQGKVADILVSWAKTIVGHIRGGLSLATVIVGMIFAGISGSGSADAAALGSTLIPAMEREGYGQEYAAGVVVSAALLGPIIPPSIIMVVYAVIAEVSIAAMFIGGIIPGLLLGGADMIIALIISHRRRYPRTERRATLWEFLKQTKEAFLALLAPGIILGGILTGAVTPTEAGALAVAYSLFLSMAYYKTLTLRDLPELLWNTVLVSCAAYLLVGMSAISAWALAAAGLPEAIMKFILSLTTSKVLILFLVNVLFLILGCLMEAIAAMIIFLPILMPLFKSLGVDPVHIGIIISVNLSIGLVTPPVGACLFVVGGITKLAVEKIARAALPFIIANILILLVLTYLPNVVMWLPRLVLK